MGAGTASLFGPTAAGSAALSAFGPMAAPMAGMGGGMASLFGPEAATMGGSLMAGAAPEMVAGGTEGAGLLSRLQGAMTSQNVGRGFKAINAASKVQGLLSPPQQQMAAPHAYGGPPPQNTQIYPQQTVGSGTDADKLKQLLALLATLQSSGQQTV
jgi:hypothetical protein